MHGMILPNSGRDGAVGWGCEAATGASLKPKQKDWEVSIFKKIYQDIQSFLLRCGN